MQAEYVTPVGFLRYRKLQHSYRWVVSLAIVLFCFTHSLAKAQGDSSAVNPRVPVRALYIPLADHYAAVVAYERYGPSLKHADFQIQQLSNWDLLRAYFYEGRADMAFVMSPLAMDMYADMQNFRWVGLMHRDGNALAVNDVILEELKLSESRLDRKPTEELANVLKAFSETASHQITVGVPHILSTHSVVLHTYLNTYGITMDLLPNNGGQVLVKAVAPPKAPLAILSEANRATPAAFEQSLPWADVVETQGFGKVAWYSKDVIPWPKGHVECIAIASDVAIAEKQKAIKEVMTAIHRAGADIEKARKVGGEELEEIVKLVRKHIPLHSREAILASLHPALEVINYNDLNIDPEGLEHIMELAVKAKILKKAINIEEFSAPEFKVNLEQKECCAHE